MKITTVLFDLDGTLLPMDQDRFLSAYLHSLAAKLAHRGYEPKKLVSAILAGTDSMIKNDGSKRNEEAFWQTFTSIFGENAKNDLPYFEEFYRTDFDGVKVSCGYNSEAKNAIAKITDMGYKIALATNPLFPSIATEKRICWAGLSPDDFLLITTYENSSYCKPNIEYYKAVTAELGVTPEECIMVGNDTADDMVAEKLGMKVFLLTDCLINSDGRNIDAYPHGSFPELISYLENLRQVQ